ncbi:Dihydrolipoyllysine-residue acetyltransferase component of pyruvate dehydrogenase complex [bioreactor metagenome]|uniref:Dihydrolipoyllysine-residue acetyltransferase component of pyruvate dehydrogenase complex n=1 Tax=bioreactor metagenome TaxID=1076179 RepID=A0A644YPP6_9ZZZZ
MSTIVTMPQKGLTEVSAVLAKWYVKPGDHVKAGDYLFAIEIGKATFDVESEAEGIVLAMWAQEGEDVPVKAPVCAIGQAGEAAERPNKAAQDQPADTSDNVALKVSVPLPPAAAADIPPAELRFISPRAKEAALRRGIDYRFAVPTGAEGRIIERDIDAMAVTGPFITDAARGTSECLRQGIGLGGTVTTADLGKEPRAAASSVDAGEYVAKPNSNMRKLIARNMHESLAQLAQFTLSADFDATELLGYCEMAKAEGAACGLSKLTLNDIVVYTTARVLKDYPDMNALYGDEETRLYAHVNAGVAVDTPRGLMVPTLFRADEKSLDEIAREIRDLAAECREGRLAPELLTGGTITVSNLGAMGITSFTPVINPPQVCLLGVCGLQWKLRVDENGAPHYYQAMGLSLTIDHRAVDGAPAARFLQALCRRLEKFTLELAK